MPSWRRHHHGRAALVPLEPRDVYVACHSSVDGWGGGLAFANGLAEAFRQHGLTTLLIGLNDGALPPCAVHPATPHLNVHNPVPRWLWRVHSWRLPAGLAQTLAGLPPPKRAFVTVSPTWVSAAKRAWPDRPVAFVFACLLTNCLPFTWAARRRPPLWRWVDYAGIRRAERLALALADLTLAPTRQSVEEIQAFAPQCAARLQQCDYGVGPVDAAPHLRQQKRSELGLGADAFLVGAIGRCDRNKAFDLAIRELPRMDPRAHLVIIGGGPEEDALRRLAHDLRVTDRVRLVGPQRAMGPWYAAVDCVASTSQYDTFPNALTEAMYAGLPVLAPEHAPPHVYSGLAEVVRTHGGGWCYDRRRPGALATCVNRLIGEPRTRHALGTQARTVCRQRFRWTTCVDRILAHLARRQ